MMEEKHINKIIKKFCKNKKVGIDVIYKILWGHVFKGKDHNMVKKKEQKKQEMKKDCVKSKEQESKAGNPNEHGYNKPKVKK